MQLLIAILIAATTHVTHRELSGAKLGFAGLGPVHIGMTPAQAREAIRDVTEDKAASGECHYTHLKSDRGVLFMISNGRVARVDIEDSHHATISGVRVGDSERAVKRAYRGRYAQSPHKYVAKGHYFTVRSSDRKFALVIETDGTRVTSMRCGAVPEAEYVEGCS